MAKRSILILLSLLASIAAHTTASLGGIAVVTPPSNVYPPAGPGGCGETDTSNTMTVGTPNSLVTAGDYLFLVISGIGSLQGAAGSTTVVTGITNQTGPCLDGSCVWHQVPNIAVPYDDIGGRSDIWYAKVPLSGTSGTVVRINTSPANTFVGACMFEVSGLATSNIVDQALAADITTPLTTNLTTPMLLGNVQPEFFLAVSSCANIGYLVASPFIGIDATDGPFPDGVGGCPAGYLISSSTGPQAATLIQNPPLSTGAVSIASFKGAAATIGSCTPPPTGMIRWYPGDGNTGDLIEGTSATVTGRVSFMTGEVAQAFAFDGSTGYLDLGNAGDLQISGADFTVDAWVNFARTSGEMSIVDKLNPANGGDGWRLYKQSDNLFDFCFGDGKGGCTAGAVSSVTVAQTSSWYHVTAVKSGTTAELYVNGALEGSATIPPFVDTNKGSLVVGHNVLAGAFLNGLVDEVEIFSRALDAGEINAIYSAGSAGKCKGGATPTPTASVVVTPTATATRTATPTVTGSATPTPTPSPTPTEATTLAVSPPKLAFGQVVATTSSAAHRLRLQNKGSVPAIIGAFVGDSLNFSKNTCTATLAAKRSCTVSVSLTPPLVGTVNGTLTIRYNGPGAQVGIAGTASAVKATAPKVVRFGTLKAGTNGAPKTIIISNHSRVALESMVANPPTSKNFVIVSDGCTGQPLASKAQCTAKVEFTPQAGVSSLVTDSFGYSYSYGANAGSIAVAIRGRAR
jgi:hypothetical protein